MDRIPTWPVAAGGLTAGFAVASATGIRALGAVPLVAAGAWCAVAWHRRAGTRVAAELVGAYFAAFVASHLLALATGGWPAVVIVSAAVALAARVRADAVALA